MNEPRTLADFWEEFREECLPDDVTEEDASAVRLVFFSGASAVLGAALAQFPDSPAMLALAPLAREVEGFCEPGLREWERLQGWRN